MQTATHSVSFTIPNPTAEQMEAITNLLSGGTTTKKKSRSRAQPEETVSEEEDENFGKKPLTKRKLKAEDAEESEDNEEEESEDDEAESDEDAEESDDEEEGLTFSELKKVMNKYGEKKPKDMKAILLAFNIKSTAELETKKSKWEPVYRKVMAKLKK